MAYLSFEEALKKTPEEIKNWVLYNAHLYAEKYFGLFELDLEKDVRFFASLVVFLQKIGIKYYEVPNRYTLQYLIENILNIDKEFAQKLADVIWTDFLPAVNKVWQGEKLPKVTLPEREERLQKAIVAQMEMEEETKKAPPKEKEKPIIEEKKRETLTQTAEKTVTPSKEEVSQMPTSKETEAEEKKISIEAMTEKETKEPTSEPGKIPVEPIPTITWEEKKETPVEKEAEIVIEEEAKKEEPPEEKEGPIDVSSY